MAARINNARSLHGQSIFLSASVPSLSRSEVYRRVENVAFEIEQAVISLARAVFSAGGTLVFGGHPAISPLVAMVAGEYSEPSVAERSERQRPLTRIYQSRAFEKHAPDATLLMYRLGYAEIVWVDAVEGEEYEPEIRDKPPCPLSLKQMRQIMIKESHPLAMVCIGGMEGVEDETVLFRQQRPSAPIYILESTGGASQRLASIENSEVEVIDREIMTDLERSRSKFHEKPVPEQQEHLRVVPYPLIMQTIVSRLMKS